MALTPAQMDAFNDRAMARNIATVEREVLTNYREAIRKIRADIAKVYDKFAINGELTHAEMSKFNRLTSLEKQLTEDLRPALRKNAAITAKMQRVEYDEAFFRTAWTIDQQLGASLSWGQLNPKAVTAAVANPLNLIANTRLRLGSIVSIRRAVTQGLIQGLSFPNMMKDVRGVINGSAKDALRIVRTEGQRAQVLGQQANYEEARELGVEVDEVWDAILDSRLRPEHGTMDGRIETEQGFSTAGTSLVNNFVAGPLQSGVASFDINCRCRVRGQIKDFEPKKRRVEGEIVDFETYTQWKKRTGK